MKSTIFAFGDSITHGAYDTELGGWANRLRLYFMTEEAKRDDYDVRFYQLGIPGENTDGLVKRFENETKARLRDGFDNIFIFAFGANDAAFLPQQKTYAVPIDRFEKNLLSVILQAQKLSLKIILLNITPVVEKFSASPKEHKKFRTNEGYVPYNECIKKLAKAYNTKFVDVNTAFTQHGYESLLPDDGLHPNSEGHKIISDLVLKTIQEL